MKKRIITLALVLILCLSLVPVTAMAAGVSSTAQGVTLTIDKSNYAAGETINYSWSGMTDEHASGVIWGYKIIVKAGSGHEVQDYTPLGKYADGEATLYAPAEDGVYELRLYWGTALWWDAADGFITSVTFTVGNVKTGSISIPQTEYTAQTDIVIDYSGITAEMESAKALVGIFKPGAEHDLNSRVGLNSYKHVKAGAGQVTLTVPNINGDFELRLYNTLNGLTAEHLVMSIPFTVSGATADEWALPELERADELGLIPDSLKGADLTQPITRAEFAAVAVKMYEKMSGTKAAAPAENPFTDTSDPEVLKAANIGIVDGYGDGIFRPDQLLSREQAATMLTRVYKKLTMPGWSIVTDESFPLSFTMPAKFTDDAYISGYAYESVYYMAANSILQGDNGLFLPNNNVPGYEAFGGAQRQHAIIISLRVVENLDA